MTVAAFCGTFSPITLGHLDVIERASVIFDKVVVLVSPNSEKETTYSEKQRCDWIKEACAHLNNVEVDVQSGLSVASAKAHNATVLIRGIRSIGKVSSVVVPGMAAFYFVTASIVIIANINAIPAGVAEMFAMAFSFDSVAGGVGGSIVASMLTAMRWGVARGVFSNEAGLGSAPIAAAAARTDHASRQGYVNMTGTFFDTMIVCMLTGLVIASSGMLGVVNPETGELFSGAELTIAAFSTVFGDYGKLIISISLSLFAFSTILGWEYYGEKALEYLIKKRPVIMGYRILFSLVTFVGATTALEVVWNFSDTMNGLMAIPNLICLLWLNKDIADECFAFQREVVVKEKRGEVVDMTGE